MVQKLYHSIVALYILICSVYCQEGANSSLTFVIDNTVSMLKEIKSVMQCADGIFDSVVNSNESGIVDFVIVTFNDPGFQLRVITNNKDEFKSSLYKIRAEGGGDCPEKAMSGIELGLKSSRPFSYLFVFTDATANDMEKYEVVKNLALNLNIKINFIITEYFECDSNYRNFSAYEALATKTGGDYFTIRKNKIPEIVKYVKKSIESRKVEILRKRFRPDEEKKVDVTLDSGIKDALVVVTGGDKSTIHVKDKFNATVPVEDIADIKKSKIVAWNNTAPGGYHVELNKTDNKTNTLLIIHGTSKITFSYGFSALKPENMNDTTNRPVPDQKSYILIKLKTEAKKIHLPRIQVVDLKDKTLLDKSMNVIEKYQLYISEPIIFPKDTFKIVMIAEDEGTKETIKRTSLPIESQKVLPGTIKDEGPKVSITGNPKVILSHESPLQLTCKVTGHPKPKIFWTDDFGSTLTFTVTTIKLEYQFVSVLDVGKVNKNNTYICKANNSISSDEKSVKVEIPYYFDVINLSKDKKVEYNKEEKLYCNVKAIPPANVTWYLNGKEVVTDDNLSISSDQMTLLIKQMKLKYVGNFLCEIRNNMKRHTTTTIGYNYRRIQLHNIQLTIIGVEAPKIDNKITEICVNKGSNAKISCRILKGNPKPTIEWYFKAKNKDSFYPIKEYKEDVHIDKVTANVVGTYKCIANNEIDKDSHIIDLVMEYSPVILGKKHLDIIKQIGKPVKIPCEIQGEPAPEIHWSINGVGVEDTEPYKIYRDHTLTFKASIETMGKYSCEGVNKLGSIKKTANVSVFEPVSFGVPKELRIKIRVGRTLDISCPVKGYPTPKVRWEFYSIDGTIRRTLSEKAQLIISAIQASEHGYYVCVAINPDGEEKALRYVVNVEVPPSIIPEEKNIVAVVGDIGIRIPCNSYGDPKPTISWIYQGQPLATGYEYYDMESDGTLVIKNVKGSVAGMYACVAESDLGKVFENFNVKIEAFPRKSNIVSEKYLEVSQSAVVQCNVPHSATDQIRWYKGRNVVAYGDLIFNKYESSRSGFYKCRVSNYYKSITGYVRIKTGFKPHFAYSTIQHNFMFYEPNLCLNCGNSANPKAKISWWKNKMRIFSSNETYCCKNVVSSIGEYECVVENELGKISQKFYVTGNDCLIDIKEEFDRHHPLVLNRYNKLSDFYVIDGHLAIPIGHSAQFFCQGSFNRFTDSSLKAECVESQIFKINGEQMDFSKLKCKEALQPVTINKKEHCANGNGEIFRIGINVNEFLEVYHICFHRKLKIPLYAEYNLKASAAGVNCASPEKWFNGDVINYNKDEMYDCKQQRNYLTAILGRDLPGKEDECFGSRQLVNEKDLPAGFPQMLTHSYLNIIPQWNSDSMKNWDILEEILRTQVKKRHRSFTRSNVFIRTGVSQNFRLPIGKSKSRSDIYIKDKAGYKFILPVFLWKVITDQLSAATVVIIQVIIPGSLRGDDIKNYEICTNQCDKLQWLDGIDAEYLKSGYMLCCSINDFEKAFSYRVSFSMGYNKILSIFSR